MKKITESPEFWWEFKLLSDPECFELSSKISADCKQFLFRMSRSCSHCFIDNPPQVSPVRVQWLWKGVPQSLLYEIETTLDIPCLYTLLRYTPSGKFRVLDFKDTFPPVCRVRRDVGRHRQFWVLGLYFSPSVVVRTKSRFVLPYYIM